jgi:hypothetical protein
MSIRSGRGRVRSYRTDALQFVVEDVDDALHVLGKPLDDGLEA